MINRLLYKHVLSIVKNKNRRISLANIYKELEKINPNLHKKILFDGNSYVELTEVINKLINEGIIKPTNNGKDTNRRNPPIPLNFNIVDEEPLKYDIKKEMLYYHHPINMQKYYLSNSDDFVSDKEYIDIIAKFIKENSEETEIPINERSYELFGDEKFLKNPGEKPKGQLILERLGLNYKDLNCYYTYEQFFYYAKVGYRTKEQKNIVIVENKDTYWSIHKLMEEYLDLLNIDVLIYGEGKKIISSFKYGEVIGLTKDDKYFYFGDLDREGAKIVYLLMIEYPEWNIELFKPAYYELLNSSINKTINPTKKNQRIRREELEWFLNNLPDIREKAKVILEKGEYIPQEALNYKIMKTQLEKGGQLWTL